MQASSTKKTQLENGHDQNVNMQKENFGWPLTETYILWYKGIPSFLLFLWLFVSSIVYSLYNKWIIAIWVIGEEDSSVLHVLFIPMFVRLILCDQGSDIRTIPHLHIESLL